jgi:hypothetical protein
MREHGTHVKYVVDRCRCDECRRANREYENNRRRRKAYGGDYWPWVDAEPIRRHVLSLMGTEHDGKDGLGPKRIAQISGVSHSAISKLIYGDYGRKTLPSRRIRRDTAEKLLAVKREDAYYLPATSAWKHIDELVGFGVPKARIARALGTKTPALQLSRRYVTAKNAKAVEGLHWAVWRAEPRFRVVCECLVPQDVADWLEAS